MRDWAKVARDYDAFAFDMDKRGENLPLIKWDKAPGASTNRVFAINSFVGWGDHAYETITCLGAVNGATVAGIDKSSQQGQNWVRLCANYFNTTPGIDLYLNNPNDRTGNSFWYELFPNILFYRIFSSYPETPGMANQFTTVADRWIDACVGMGGSVEPRMVPNFDHTSFNFLTGKPVDNGLWKEGGSAAAIAWLEYMAYVRTGNEKYLSAAKWGLDYLQQATRSPYYEVLFPHGPYVAARMNVEKGTQYDIEKLVNWCFDGSNRRRWGESAGKWGDKDFSGIACSLEGTSEGTYAFSMNTFNKANSLVPLVRYDSRFARAVGKWMLNAANSMRYFYSNGLPADHQTDHDWAAKHDPDACIAYEGIRRQQSTISRIESTFKTRHGRVKSGTVKDTVFVNKSSQALEEERIGDRDHLEHIWKASLPKADTHRLNMMAQTSGGEAFSVSYAAKPEGPYTRLCVFDSAEPQVRAGRLLIEGGDLYLRVQDLGQDREDDRLDSFSVDDVWILSKNNKSPFATGDAKANGWARTNFGLYGSSFVGLFGGIIETTNVKGILQLDCLATDYFHAAAYPTYLYHNPFETEKEVVIDVGPRSSDLYDTVSNTFMKKNINGRASFTVPADSAVVVVVAPSRETVSHQGTRILINGVIVDYAAGKTEK
jgi:hypothetical protein